MSENMKPSEYIVGGRLGQMQYRVVEAVCEKYGNNNCVRTIIRAHFGEGPMPTLEDCKKMIDEEYNNGVDPLDPCYDVDGPNYYLDEWLMQRSDPVGAYGTYKPIKPVHKEDAWSKIDLDAIKDMLSRMWPKQ